MSLFIADGFTQSKSLPGVPGLHPAVTLVYRPTASKERTVYGLKLDSKNPDVIDGYENDLLLRQTVSINGEELKTKERAATLHPVVRTQLIDLILCYKPGDEATEGKGSSGASG